MGEIKRLFLILLVSIIFLYGCTDGDIVQSNPITGRAIEEINADQEEIAAPEEEITEEKIIEKEPIQSKTEENIEKINIAKKHDIKVFGKEGFDPQELTITKGDNVSWRNEGYSGMILLIFKDDEPYLHQNSLNSRDTFSHEFNEIGSYDIYWNIANGPVKGKLIVKEKSSDVIDESAEESTKKDDAKKEHYTEEQLKEDLTSIIGTRWYKISNFTRDPSHPDYIRSSDLKYHVIHTIKNKQIKTFKDFCEIYCGENWEGITYFINQTNFESYIPLLDEGNFSTEARYKDYIKDRVLANHTRMEQVIQLKNGKILEYRFFLVQTDTFNNFQGNLAGYQLIYKIPCSSNLTVLLRPQWQDYTVSTGTGGVSGVINNWIMEDERVRDELLEAADKILDRCPIEQDFFENYDFENYFFSELLAYYWRTYYMYQFNISKTLSIGVEKKSQNDEIYLLKEINVSFTNNDYYDLNGVGLKITVIADDESETDYYDKEFDGTYRPGKIIINKSFSLKDIEFKDNITIDANLYSLYGEQEIRPQKYFFTKEDFN